MKHFSILQHRNYLFKAFSLLKNETARFWSVFQDSKMKKHVSEAFAHLQSEEHVLKCFHIYKIKPRSFFSLFLLKSTFLKHFQIYNKKKTRFWSVCIFTKWKNSVFTFTKWKTCFLTVFSCFKNQKHVFEAFSGL